MYVHINAHITYFSLYIKYTMEYKNKYKFEKVKLVVRKIN